MLFIDNDVVAAVLTTKDCIAVQERAFAGVLTGASVSRPRLDTFVPCDRDDVCGRDALQPLAKRRVEPPRLEAHIGVARRGEVAGDDEHVARWHLGQKPMDVGGRDDAHRSRDDG